MRIAGKVTMVSVALVAAATLSACANSEQASTGELNITSTPPPPPTTASVRTTATTPPSAPSAPTGPECTADDIKVDGAFGAKPTITIPATCQPPKKLITKDLTPGTGAEVKSGSQLQANYLLQTWSDKKLVDNSFDRGKPFDVQVGAGDVIKGWDEGLIGLKQGGRRLLVIPPDLGYGPQGKAPVKPNETLVFVTDAVQVS